MWIFTKHGFFSAVCARKRNKQHGQPGDPDCIMVRSSLHSQLRALRARFPELLREFDIQDSEGTAYACSLVVPKSVWARVLTGLAEEMEYDNFRTEVARQQGQAGADYEHSLHEVWSVMRRLRETGGIPPVTAQQIDAVLPFLDRFESAGFSAGEWQTPDRQMPWFKFNETVSEFCQALYDNGWVTPAFDWNAWQQSAQEFVDAPQKLENADATTILKLFTTHVRADRFCEGHLASVFQSGHIVALLRRLKKLRQ